MAPPGGAGRRARGAPRVAADEAQGLVHRPTVALAIIEDAERDHRNPNVEVAVSLRVIADEQIVTGGVFDERRAAQDAAVANHPGKEDGAGGDGQERGLAEACPGCASP